MRKLIRFFDLQKRGIVGNRMTLSRWIENEGFPPGVLLGPNTRAWEEDAVETWLASRPAILERDFTAETEAAAKKDPAIATGSPTVKRLLPPPKAIGPSRSRRSRDERVQILSGRRRGGSASKRSGIRDQ